MNKQGGSYILATLIIMLAIIFALMYSPRFIDDSPFSGRTELLEGVLKGVLRSEVASRTTKAFEYFKEYMKYFEVGGLEIIEEKLKDNNFLSDGKLGGSLIKSIYSIRINKFREFKWEYRMEGNPIQGRCLVNLTYFNLTLYYDFTDPVLGRLNGSKSYHMNLSKIDNGKLTPVSEMVLYQLDLNFTVKDTYGPVKYIKYAVYVLNNTQIEPVAHGFQESDNGCYELSVLIRPEYYIMLKKGEPYSEFGLVLVVSGSRGETLWVVTKVN